MVDFILLIFLTSLWIWGIHAFMELSGLSESFEGKYTRFHLPMFIQKPLWVCPPCCSSVHGSASFLIFYEHNFLLWPIFCISLCGLNYIIKESLYGNMDAK